MEDIEEISNSSSIETKAKSKNGFHSNKTGSRLSESESSSSWENKTINVKGYEFDENNIRYPKTPERRLKLTIRVKRSPTTSNSNSCSSFQHDFESGVESEPQYEIIRASEGIHSDMSEFEIESLPSTETISKKSKRKKRHKRKKSKYRADKERDDEKLAENGADDEHAPADNEAKRSKNLSFAATTTKRVKLMFGNEMKILNIPDGIGKETTTLDSSNSLKGRILLTKCL